MSNILEVNDSNFDSEVINADLPVLVDLWAPWCQPCRITAPVIDELAGEYNGKVKVAKLNIDSNPQTPDRYGIRSIPTLLFFKGGELVDTVVGAVGKKAIEESINKLI